MRALLVFALCLSGCYANSAPVAGEDSLTSCENLPGPCVAQLESMDLTGCILSGYIGAVHIGSQSFNLIMDTGSTSIGVAASTCTNCTDISPLLQAQDPNSSIKSVVSSYGDGSGWNGSPDATTVSVSSSVQPMQLDVAAVQSQTFAPSGTGFFRPNQCTGQSESNTYQGIFGLAGTPLALPGTQSFVDALQTQTQTEAFAFAPCSSGGSMWMGGYVPGAVSAAPQFTPMNMQQGYYEITIADLQFQGKSMDLTGSAQNNTVVDTGTSVLTLPAATFTSLSQAIARVGSFTHYFPATFFTDGACVVPEGAVSRGSLDAALPPLEIVLPSGDGTGNVTVQLQATEGYLTPAVTPAGLQCFLPGIAQQTNSQGPQIIFGASAMQRHVMVFDRGGQQLGIAASTLCID